MHKKSGFSLIELLVVVVIIGVLGAVGLVGYQSYIEQSRDATTKDNFEFLKRTLDQDIVSVENDLNSRSKFAETLTSQSKCYTLRDRYISEINLERNNPFNDAQGLICDGNHYASYANGGGTDNNSIKIKRGRTMVYCDGIDFANASYKLVSGKLGMKFCTCTGQEECPTTKRFEGRLTVDTPNTGTVVLTISGVDNYTTVPSTRLKTLLVGSQTVTFDQVAVNSDPFQIIVNGLQTIVPANTMVYEVNADICFTPHGASDLATYRTTSLGGEGLYSTLAYGSNTMSERHRCY